MSRYIDADAFKEDVKHHLSVLAYAGSHAIKLGTLEQWLDNTPSIDIVRCKECAHGTYCEKAEMYICNANDQDLYEAEHFCSYGEREGE